MNNLCTFTLIFSSSPNKNVLITALRKTMFGIFKDLLSECVSVEMVLRDFSAWRVWIMNMRMAKIISLSEFRTVQHLIFSLIHFLSSGMLLKMLFDFSNANAKWNEMLRVSVILFSGKTRQWLIFSIILFILIYRQLKLSSIAVIRMGFRLMGSAMLTKCAELNSCGKIQSGETHPDFGERLYKNACS